MHAGLLKNLINRFAMLDGPIRFPIIHFEELP
jgi:hypothetical protein